MNSTFTILKGVAKRLLEDVGKIYEIVMQKPLPEGVLQREYLLENCKINKYTK